MLEGEESVLQSAMQKQSISKAKKKIIKAAKLPPFKKESEKESEQV